VRFAEPHLLWSLLAVAVVALISLWLGRWRRRALARVGNVATLQGLSSAPGAEWRSFRLLLLLAGMAALSLALGRPQWGASEQEVRRKGIDLVMVVDVSRSMLAEDLPPSRLERARESIGDLLDRLPDQRVALVAFAGSAQVLCPLTLDHSAARIFLDILDPQLIPEPGTALAQAIQVGAELFDPGQTKYKVMVLITDGEDHDTNPQEQIAQAVDEGIVLYSLGMGTTAGQPIPVRDASGKTVDYVRDEQGQVVTSRLDSAILEQAARLSGGDFYLSTAGGQELDRIAESIRDMDRKELSARLATHMEDRFQIPLILALLALALEAALSDRRKVARGSP
jgi:Ca-activated chloride channel family protein